MPNAEGMSNQEWRNSFAARIRASWFVIRHSSFVIMSDVQIHPTAIIDPGAEIGAGTIVGPYCVIGPDVQLGPDCWLQNHVTLCGPMKAGAKNRFYAYCSIGQQTQDLKYRGEPTYLEIG